MPVPDKLLTYSHKGRTKVRYGINCIRKPILRISVLLVSHLTTEPR